MCLYNKMASSSFPISSLPREPLPAYPSRSLDQVIANGSYEMEESPLRLYSVLPTGSNEAHQNRTLARKCTETLCSISSSVCSVGYCILLIMIVLGLLAYIIWMIIRHVRDSIHRGQVSFYHINMGNVWTDLLRNKALRAADMELFGDSVCFGQDDFIGF
jgi:hypothetical protein